MGANDQPGQLQVGAVFADGVLTITGDLFTNPAVAASLDDAVNTVVVAVTGASSGLVHFVVTVTPDTAIASADNTVGGAVRNLQALGA